MRLIDADALIAEWCDGCKYLENGLCDSDICGGVLLMKDAPTIDAVEVVRCKDCKHWDKYALACDTLPWVSSSEHANWYAEDFCSYGERRSDD